MTIGIYLIKNKNDGKFYIGSSLNIESRFLVHKSELRNKKHGNSYLQNAWNKYGEENFVFEILMECEKDSVRELEQEFLNKSVGQDFCYNINPNADGISSKQATENNIKRWSNPDEKIKQSDTQKNVWKDEDLLNRHKDSVIEGLSKINREKWHINIIESHNSINYKKTASENAKKQWEEHRDNMLQFLQKEETRDKISISISNKFKDDSFRKKHKEKTKEALNKKEYKEKQRKSGLERFKSPELRKKYQENCKNKKAVKYGEDIFPSLREASIKLKTSIKNIKFHIEKGTPFNDKFFEFVKQDVSSDSNLSKSDSRTPEGEEMCTILLGRQWIEQEVNHDHT